MERMKKTTISINHDNIVKLRKLYPELSLDKAICMLLKEREQILTKKDVFNYIDSRANNYIKDLEKRLKGAIGEF